MASIRLQKSLVYTLGPVVTGGGKQPTFRTARAQRTVRPLRTRSASANAAGPAVLLGSQPTVPGNAAGKLLQVGKMGENGTYFENLQIFCGKMGIMLRQKPKKTLFPGPGGLWGGGGVY